MITIVGEEKRGSQTGKIVAGTGSHLDRLPGLQRGHLWEWSDIVRCDGIRATYGAVPFDVERGAWITARNAVRRPGDKDCPERRDSDRYLGVHDESPYVRLRECWTWKLRGSTID